MRGMFIKEEDATLMPKPANTGPAPDLHSFLHEVLAEQQQLQTPVARFSDRHPSLATSHTSVYKDLIPLSAPKAGEQYAFEVDLDSCSGCKACVAGCHSLNGLDEEETWRDVGLVVGGDHRNPFQQTITSACHHCADPGCMNGCPVLAYEKDPVTGIVRHLDDQCIGCSYCVLKCPYDVPKYNNRLGIVRKCDMCHSRLAEGEAPACVQACPTHAIRIVTVQVDKANGHKPRFDTSGFLAAAPEPSYTQPTTRYLSKRALPENLRAADARALRPQHPHWALVFLLVFTQVSVGLLAGSLLAPPAGTFGFVTYCVTNVAGVLPLGLMAWAFAAAGLGASVAHLGQPLRAWRVFLGLRRSWLSREAVVLGGYFGLLSMSVVVHHPVVQLAALSTGILGVFCSVMIYVDTRRPFWKFSQSATRMFGTVAITTLACVSVPLAAAALCAKLIVEAATLDGENATARLQLGPLHNAKRFRFACGAVAIALFVLGPPAPGLALWLIGEIAERYLYFRAVDAPKMPGGTSA